MCVVGVGMKINYVNNFARKIHDGFENFQKIVVNPSKESEITYEQMDTYKLFQVHTVVHLVKTEIKQYI
jgi:hypothetical protein